MLSTCAERRRRGKSQCVRHVALPRDSVDREPLLHRATAENGADIYSEYDAAAL